MIQLSLQIYQLLFMNLSIDILEAEGDLNRQITAALQSFRGKINQQIQKDQNQKIKDHYDTSKEGAQKLFRFRQSLLSLKFQIQDYKTIYNMMAASFLILAFCLVYDSYVTKGSIIDVVAFMNFFRGSQKVFITWWLLILIHFTVIVVVFIGLRTSSKIWIPLYIIHQYALLHIGIRNSYQNNLGFASVFIILCETIRMVMKSHSYFRTKMLYLTKNQYKNFNPIPSRKHKQKKQEQEAKKENVKRKQSKELKQLKQLKQAIQLIQSRQAKFAQQTTQVKTVMPNITFSDVFDQIARLSYFFIIPTLVYRDEYTRTPIRSLSKIIAHLVNFLACIYYIFMLYIMICKENIENLQKKLDFNTFALTLVRLVFPSVGFLILGFFGFLHSWMNMWAQITRFPDRAFYSDWWNSFQFGTYYRKWNIVVHDWLYYYIYLDSRRFIPICRKYKFLPQLLTFLISAIIHQTIVCLAIGFFYPILFILFTGPGIILIQNQRRLKKISVNFMFWLEMYIGTSLLFSFYLVQSFAREVISDQVIKADFKYLAFLIPRTFYLGKVK